MANLSITLSPHPEERRKARFEGWSSIFRRLPGPSFETPLRGSSG